MNELVTCPTCRQPAPARPIEVIARGHRQRLRPQPGRRLARVEVAEHGSCPGAGCVVEIQERAR